MEEQGVSAVHLGKDKEPGQLHIIPSCRVSLYQSHLIFKCW